MTPQPLPMVCVATAVAATLFGACGTGQPKSDDEPVGARRPGTETPACAELVGRAMTAGFAGCESGGRFIEATRTPCADGRVLIAPDYARSGSWTDAQIDEVVWGFVGERIQAGAGDGALYATMFIDCNDF